MAQNKMPTEVQAGVYRFTVACDQAQIDRKRTVYGQACRCGNLDRWKQEIVITPELAPDSTRVALLHEVLHCCYLAAGRDDKELIEEDVCGFLDATLLDTLRRNPKLLAYLLEGTDA